MKAILTYTTMIDDKLVEQTRLFDTATAKKICDVRNSFKNIVQGLYITKKGTIFVHNISKNTLEVVDQKKAREWIGEHEPNKYIKLFGEVEEG